MNRAYNPNDIAAPYKNRYSHAIEVSAGSRMLFVSGTVPTRPDGTIPVEFADQVETVMQNLTAILKEADMDWSNVVKGNGYLTPQADIATYAQVREKYLPQQKPALTVVWVAGLADARWMIEMDLIAAK